MWFTMKEHLSSPRLLDRRSLGQVLAMAGLGEMQNLAGIIHTIDDLPANPHREVGRGPYSTNRIRHSRHRVKSIMLIIRHRYQVARVSALQIGI
jgi:hypothetical protein